jgi:hypothetical protein
MYNSSGAMYQSREDRLRDLERERMLYSNNSLQNLSDVSSEEPKWDTKKSYKSSAYDYVYPEFSQHVDIPTIADAPSRSRSRSRLRKEDKVPLRFVNDSPEGKSGRNAYIDLDALSSKKLSRSLSEYEVATRERKKQEKEERQRQELHTVHRLVKGDLVTKPRGSLRKVKQY